MNYRSPSRRLASKQQSVQWRIFLGLFFLILVAGAGYATLIFWVTEKAPPTVYFNIVNAWERLGIFIFVGNLLMLVIAGGISAVIAMYINNQSTAPLYRLEELCEEVSEGQLDSVNMPREKGRFRKLSQAFRVMVNKLYLRRTQQIDHLDLINQLLQELRSGLNLTGKQRDVLNELEMQLQQLEKAL